jgi:hypothetical protein
MGPKRKLLPGETEDQAANPLPTDQPMTLGGVPQNQPQSQVPDLESVKALLDKLKPQPVSMDFPAPQLPQGPDPQVIKDTLDRAQRLQMLHGIFGVHTPSTYEVMRSGKADVTVPPSPSYDAAMSRVTAPLQAEQARVGLANQQGEVQNKYAQEKAKFGLETQKSNNAPGLAEMKGMLTAWGLGQRLNAQADVAGKKNASQEKIAGGHDQAKITAAGMGDGDGGLQDAALDQAAERYYKTTELPPLGQGAAGATARKKIINRAAELHPVADLAGNRAGYGADRASLQKLQTTADQTDAREGTALKNLDVFLDVAKRVTDTGSPALTKPARWLDENMGDPNIAAFRAARQTAVSEIAAVLNAQNSQVSDSARHEVNDLIGPNATGAQIAEAAKILKQDMANRKAANQEQLGTIKGRISGAPAEKQVVKWQKNVNTGKRRPVYSDGSYGPEQ